jgi:hypothetical protein
VSVRWAGHVACIGETNHTNRILAKKLMGRHHLGDVGVDALTEHQAMETYCGSGDIALLIL